MDIPLKYIKVHEDAIPPKRGTKFSAGLDLFSPRDCKIEPHGKKVIFTVNGWTR